MDFKLEMRDGLLWVTVTGPVSLNDAVGISKKALDAATDRGTDLILVDCTSVTGILSALERYKLGSAAAKYARGRPGIFTMAVVGHPPVIDGLAALVASNRGLTSSVFSDIPKAVAWLSGFRPPMGIESSQ